MPQNRPPVEIPEEPKSEAWEATPLTAEQLRNGVFVIPPSARPRVILRYAGTPRPGDQPITNMRYTYDGGRRALIVDPGMMLAEGRQLELLLFPGIVDSEGLALVPRASPPLGTPMADGPIDILRYSTGS